MPDSAAQTADDGTATRSRRTLTFAGPLFGQRERTLGTHLRRGFVLFGVLLALWVTGQMSFSDAPGISLLQALLLWNTVLLGLVAAAGGAEALSSTPAREGGDFLALAEPRPLPLAVNLLLPQVGDLLLLVIAQGPLTLLSLTLGGVMAGHVLALVMLLCGWVVVTSAISAWLASLGANGFVAVTATAVFVLLCSAVFGVLELATGAGLTLIPLFHGQAPLVSPWSAALNLAWQVAFALLLLSLAGKAVLRPRTAFIGPNPPQQADVLPAARPVESVHGPTRPSTDRTRHLARPRIDVCPHRWKAVQLHISGADGMAVRAVLAVLLWMVASLTAGSAARGLSFAGTLLLYFDAALLSARRVRQELDGDPELIRLLPAGETNAAVETRRGAWPAFVMPLLMVAVGSLLTFLKYRSDGSFSLDASRGIAFFLAQSIGTLAGVAVVARISGMLAVRFSVGRSVVGGLVSGYLIIAVVSGVLSSFAFMYFGVAGVSTAVSTISFVVPLTVLVILRWVGPRNQFQHTLIHGRFGRLTDQLPSPARPPT